jgi:hypothetical protein
MGQLRGSWRADPRSMRHGMASGAGQTRTRAKSDSGKKTAPTGGAHLSASRKKGEARGHGLARPGKGGKQARPHGGELGRLGGGRKRGKRKDMVGRPKKEKEGEKELHSNALEFKFEWN